jgi:hypothetical protein
MLSVLQGLWRDFAGNRDRFACGMAYRKFSWLLDHGRVTIALAIPMATLQFPR